MRILLADKLATECKQTLELSGHEVHNDPTLSGADLEEGLRDFQPHVLVVRSTKVSDEALGASQALELVVRAGAGYDNIDVAAASAAGIFVANCPGKNADAVAELTMGLLVSLDRKIPDNVAASRAGRWNKGVFAKAAGIKGRTLGIIGFGNIGKAVAARAQSFGMDIVVWSRSLTEDQAAEHGIRFAPTPQVLAAECDVVSIHAAATPETEGLIGAEFLSAMKDGAFIINTSRGSLIDEVALTEALDTKKLFAALDVFQNEPSGKEGDLSHPLADHPRVYLTHHIGASTNQASQAIGEEAVRVIMTFCVDGTVPNCVNMSPGTTATHMLSVRHKDRVGVLASVLDEMRKANWNVQEMENLVFEGNEAACARIRFSGQMSDDPLHRIGQLEDVLALTVVDL